MPRMHAPTAVARTLTLAAATAAVALPTLVAHAQDAVQWRVEDGGNGHWYAVLDFGDLGWDASRTAAESVGGHLATLTSAEESAFVGAIELTNRGIHLGGIQNASGPEPDGGWAWITGEVWDYTNWLEGEPSNSNDVEDRLYFSNTGSHGDKWGDGDNYCEPCVDHLTAVEWSADCNGDGIVDYGQILDGTFSDDDENGVPDFCQSPGDDDGIIDVPFDTASVIAAVAEVCLADDLQVVRLAPGRYRDSGVDGNMLKIVNCSMAIVGSTDPLNPTVLDGEDTRRLIRIENAQVTLRDLRIERGSQQGTGDEDGSGAGIFVKGGMVTVDRCVVTECKSKYHGGGAYFWNGSTAVVTDSTFERNANLQQEHRGGGAYVDASTAEFYRCNFISNASAGHGGGLAVNSGSILMVDSKLISNRAASGGNAWLSPTMKPVVENTLFCGGMPDNVNGALVCQENGTNICLDDCATHWTIESGGNGHWYQAISTSPFVDGEAIRIAVQLQGADLASIASPEEDAVILDLAETTSDGSVVLGGIGVSNGVDDSVEYVWLDGTPWDYTNWDDDSSQPDGNSAGEFVGYYQIGTLDRQVWADIAFSDGTITHAIVEYSADCNGDGIVDYGQILDGTFSDLNGNNIPDCCDDTTCTPTIQWAVEDGGNGRWYQPVTLVDATWTDARIMAETAGATLASVTSAEKTVMLNQLMLGWDWAYVGGIKVDGAWTWLNRDEWEYANWVPGNPGTDPNEVVIELRNFGDINNIDANTIYESPYRAILEWSADCNGDGIVDYGQILDGTLADCDDDGVPDSCNLNATFSDTRPGTPAGPTDYITFDVSSLPDARDTVSIEISALGELAGPARFLIAYLDEPTIENRIGVVFAGGGENCLGLVETLEMPVGGWNDAGIDGSRSIIIVGSGLDPICGEDAYTGINVTVPVIFEDCNTNGLWDACEVADGTVLDSDEDGVIDDCDGCPNDPAKTDPGICGCGNPETDDTDGDGILDCVDPCPNWPYDCSEDGQTITVAVGQPIQLAIDVAPTGGVVLLQNGTHVGTGASVIIMSGKPITIRGESGDGAVVVDGEGERRGLYCVDSACNGSVVEQVTFRNGDLGFAGGGAHLRTVAFTFLDCDFIDNRADGPDAEGDGGGLYSLECDLTLTNCGFENNAAERWAGGLCIDRGSVAMAGCTFVGNSADSGGGALVYESTFDIEACTFNGNSATSFGGGFNNAEGGSGSLRNCTFDGNTTEGAGGGAYLEDLAPEDMVENCDFLNNTAADGGGIQVAGGSDPVIQDCTFEDNIASIDGGGIQVDSSAPTIIDCLFARNDAGSGGGGINNFPSGNATVIRGVFEDNTADTGGGAANSNDSFPTYEDCTFTGNAARGINNPGAGAIYSNSGSNPGISVSTVCGNTQPGTDQIIGGFTDLGGNCITEVCDRDQDGTLDCNDGCPDDPEKIDPGQCGCGIEDLDTDKDGIADCLDPCPDWPYDCSEDGQTIFVAVDQSISAAIAAAPSGGTVEIAAGTFTPGGSIDPGGKAVTIQGAVDDVGVLLTTIDAEASGSVMVFQSGEGPETVVRDLVLTGGASVYGGGIECSNDSSPTILICLITGNTASEYGGGINCYLGCNPSIEGCTISGNAATLAGGGVSIDASSPTILGCVIEGNTAPQGAGMYFYESAKAGLGDSTVCGNDADQIGGSYTDLEGNCIADDCGDDLDDNGVPDACDPDCNGDGIPDALETDCDGNGIPDECEIADGTADDCNENGVPDACDIADGTEADLNLNQIPDSCDLARGDLNLDGCVDSGDLGLLIALWGLTDPPVGDLNGDGEISAADLGLLIGNWAPCDP